MQILVKSNISSKFKNSISFQSKKEVQNCSNQIKENDLAFETVSTAESSNGIAQVAMQNKPVEISPELRKKSQDFAQRFEVKTEEYVKIVQKDPKFFNRKLETLDKNVTASAQRFGVEKTKFVEVALKQPSLFQQSPETLDKNITASAQRFGVEKSKFVEAALKQPTLFGRLPESLERKARIYSYYKELNNIPVNNLLECLNLKADKHLLAQVLGVLINQQTEKNLSVTTKTKYAQIKEFLENNPGNYDLNIHNRKMVTENILEISKVLEKELLNNVKFKFKVI